MAEAFWLQNPVARSFLITDRFNSDRPYGNGKHEGIDLAATDSAGFPVAILAAQRGVVSKVASITTGYGTYCVVRHEWATGEVYYTWYGHMSKIDVRAGDYVQAGQHLGTAGSTGNSTGVHLHLTLQYQGHGFSGYVVADVVDPLPYFKDTVPKVREAMFVADENVPDGTSFQPGTAFTKTWRLRNSGTLAWGTGCKLSFNAGDRLGAPEMVPLPDANPGEEVLISVPMVAPTALGSYTSTWKPRDASGNSFEFPVWAKILVAGSAVQDAALFVDDVSIPAGTLVQPSETFLKQWRVKNTGTSTWKSGYTLAFLDGDQLSGVSSVAAPYTRPGEDAVVGITLQAPPVSGSYRGAWQLRNLQGQNFGEVLSVAVKVPAATSDVDELTYVDDVTFEDGVRVQPGQAMNKIWRVRNTGETTWGAGYVLAFLNGEKMGAPETVALPQIAPGQTVDITVPMTAPLKAGLYRSNWTPRNVAGQEFMWELYNQIEVISTVIPGEQKDDSKFEKDITIPDGTSIQAGASFLKTWRMRNTGTTTWTKDYKLCFQAGVQMGNIGSVASPSTVEPGQTVDISVNLTAPLTPGEHKTTWRLKNPTGEWFGNFFYALIKVPTPAPATMDNRAVFMSHETYDLWAAVKPGEVFEKIWRVRNTGKSTWGEGYTLVFLDGEKMGGPDSAPTPLTTTNQAARLRVTLTAPMKLGVYKGYWKLRDPRGQFFGPRLPVWITVK